MRTRYSVLRKFTLRACRLSDMSITSSICDEDRYTSNLYQLMNIFKISLGYSKGQLFSKHLFDSVTVLFQHCLAIRYQGGCRGMLFAFKLDGVSFPYATLMCLTHASLAKGLGLTDTFGFDSVLVEKSFHAVTRYVVATTGGYIDSPLALQIRITCYIRCTSRYIFPNSLRFFLAFPRQSLVFPATISSCHT